METQPGRTGCQINSIPKERMASTDRKMIINSGSRISGVGCIGAREDRDIAGEFRDGVLMAPTTSTAGNPVPPAYRRISLPGSRG